jgi:hypothetical protein
VPQAIRRGRVLLYDRAHRDRSGGPGPPDGHGRLDAAAATCTAWSARRYPAAPQRQTRHSSVPRSSNAASTTSSLASIRTVRTSRRRTLAPSLDQGVYPRREIDCCLAGTGLPAASAAHPSARDVFAPARHRLRPLAGSTGRRICARRANLPHSLDRGCMACPGSTCRLSQGPRHSSDDAIANYQVAREGLWEGLGEGARADDFRREAVAERG